MKVKLMIFMVLILFLSFGCSHITTEIAQVNEDYHKFVLDQSKIRMKYIACDIGLVDGLGLTSSVAFPIKTGDEAKALLNSPGISLAISEIREIAQKTNDPDTGNPYWKEEEYNICKATGLAHRAAALSVIDILKLFPQLSPYLSILTQ